MNSKNLLRYFISLVLCWLLLVPNVKAGSKGSCCGSVDDSVCPIAREAQEDKERRDILFAPMDAAIPLFAKHTFVFFIQGAADHYQPRSLEKEDVDNDRTWGRADAHDMAQIKGLAQTCPSCNVVALHIQRGGAHWYTANKPWATYLRVYADGAKVLSRHVNLLNGAHPATLTALLQRAGEWFPGTHLHLIYRGHGFGEEARGFDLSFPEWTYGIRTFAQSLKDAHLGESLASISFAACEMEGCKTVDPIYEALSPHRPPVVATDQMVDETLTRGFDYSGMARVSDRDSVETVVQKIKEVLFKKGID